MKLFRFMFMCFALRKPLVCRHDAVAELNAMPPAHLMQPTHVQQFAWRAVWLSTVEHELCRRMDNIPHQMGQLENREIFARPAPRQTHGGYPAGSSEELSG